MGLRKNYIYNSFLQITNLLYPLITLPYVSKVMGPEGIGKNTFIMSLVQFYVIFAALGISAYGVREIARLKDDKHKRDQLFNELITINAISAFFFTIIYFLMLYYSPLFYNDINYFYFAGIFILLSFTNIDWFYAGIEEFKLITIRNFIVKVISIIMLFLMVKTKEDFTYYFSISFLGLFVNNFFNFYLLKRHIKFAIVFNIRKHIKSLLFLFGTIFVTSIYTLMDTSILGFLTNDIYVGYYNISVRLYQVFIPFVTGLGLVMIPKMTIAIERGNIKEYNSLIDKSISFNFFISMPLSLFIFLFSKDLILLFTNELFLPSVISTQILAPLIGVVGLTNVLILQVLNTMRLEKYMLYSVLAGSITSLLANFILIPHYYHYGSAIATFLTEFTVCFFLVYYVYKKTTIRYNLQAALKCCVSLLPFYLFYFFFNQHIPNVFVKIFTLTFLGLSFYFFIMLYIFKNDFVISIYSKLKCKISAMR